MNIKEKKTKRYIWQHNYYEKNKDKVLKYKLLKRYPYATDELMNRLKEINNNKKNCKYNSDEYKKLTIEKKIIMNKLRRG